MDQLTVDRVDDQGDRVLAYGHKKWPDYHVIAPAGTSLKPGDRIAYEPYGYNFGWFERVVRSVKRGINEHS